MKKIYIQTLEREIKIINMYDEPACGRYWQFAIKHNAFLKTHENKINISNKNGQVRQPPIDKFNIIAVDLYEECYQFKFT